MKRVRKYCNLQILHYSWMVEWERIETQEAFSMIIVVVALCKSAWPSLAIEGS